MGLETTHELRQIIAEFSPLPPEHLTDAMDLVAELGLSSLEQTLLLTNIERTFRIQLDKDEIRKVNTLGELAHLVEDTLRRQRPST